MLEAEIKKYIKLNALAEQGGIVIFGCAGDKNIPVGELCQAFSLETKTYNRSFENLSIKNAAGVYEKSIAPLVPEALLIHIGEADRDFFAENPAEFDNEYRKLICIIKAHNPKCRIAVVSQKNYSNDSQTEEINRHLKYIADSERCEYGDIAAKKVWNPKATIDAVSFVYSIGFVHPLKNKRPLYDLVKIMFCYDT